MRFSANLGFLFADRPLPEAIAEAKRAGFDAAELHWPYDTPPEIVRDALGDTPLLGLNTSRGDAARGDFGLAALPGREAEARAAINQALDYAAAAGARNVHVMAGKAHGEAAFETFVAILQHAARQADPHGVGVLIEPLNPHDAPGYFLDGLPLACRVIDAVGSESVRIMFDCYHLWRIGEDVLRSARENMTLIGHIQFAGVPDRAEPDQGEMDYDWLLPALERAGYRGYFGAEYRPRTGNLTWLTRFRRL